MRSWCSTCFLATLTTLVSGSIYMGMHRAFCSPPSLGLNVPQQQVSTLQLPVPLWTSNSTLEHRLKLFSSGAIVASAAALLALGLRSGNRTRRKSSTQPASPANAVDTFIPPAPKNGDFVDLFCRSVNTAMEQLTLPAVRERFRLQPSGTAGQSVLDRLLAAPEHPPMPRPLWLVMVGSIPTALVWYGYYKFSVEEELFQEELRRDGRVTGCGGYGTLFPFVWGLLLGFALRLVGLEDAGNTSIEAGSLWILLGQINLYRRVNEACAAAPPEVSDGKPVLWEWWALLPPPIDVIVGVRQVHFLARAAAAERGEAWEGDAVAEEYFPFISAPRFSLKEFARSPRLWFSFTRDWKEIDLPFLRD